MQPTTSNVIDLATERRVRAQLNRERVVVIRDTDRENANRNYYAIYSYSRDAVQSEIDGLFAEVESFGNGYANFDIPRLDPCGVYIARGEVVVHPDIYPDTDIFPRPA
jgi:hypothetical protein